MKQVNIKEKKVRTIFARVFTVALIMTLLNCAYAVGIVKAASNSELARGSCGENLTWILNSDGELMITGSGKTGDYELEWDQGELSHTTVPWGAYSSLIKSVVVNGNVSGIGDCAFSYCTNLSSIDISKFGNDVSIGAFAFFGCSSLQEVNFKESVSSIGRAAFEDCDKLKRITIPESTISIGEYAFGYDCDIATDTLTKYSEFSIYCADNTTAHRYAVSSHVAYVIEEDLHHYNTSIILNPTCTAAGTSVSVCSYCNKTKTDSIQLVGHAIEKIAAKEATCTVAGNIVYYTCSVCKRAFSDFEGKTEMALSSTVIPAVSNHTWNEGKVTKGETCSKMGIMTYTCKVCGVTKVSKIARLSVKKPSIYKKNQKLNQLTVAWRKISGVKGYQVRYSIKSNMSKAKKLTVSRTSTTIKKLKSDKKYYIQVRAYKINSAHKEIYGSWSRTVSIRTK